MPKFELNERVVFYISDKKWIEYYGSARFIGRILRIMNMGLLRIEMEGTGSQDSEGHNNYTDVHPKAVRKLKPRRKLK